MSFQQLSNFRFPPFHALPLGPVIHLEAALGPDLLVAFDYFSIRTRYLPNPMNLPPPIITIAVLSPVLVDCRSLSARPPSTCTPPSLSPLLPQNLQPPKPQRTPVPQQIHQNVILHNTLIRESPQKPKLLNPQTKRLIPIR